MVFLGSAEQICKGFAKTSSALVFNLYNRFSDLEQIRIPYLIQKTDRPVCPWLSARYFDLPNIFELGYVAG